MVAGFASVLGLATSGISAFMGMSQAQDQLDYAYYQMAVADAAQQRKEQYDLYVLGKNEEYYYDSVNRYNELMGFYERDRSQASSERDTFLDLMYEDRARQGNLYEQLQGRQDLADRYAFMDREQALSEYGRSQELAAMERMFGLDQFYYAQDTAARESAFAQQLLLEDRMRQNDHYAMLVGRQQQLDNAALGNRNFYMDQFMQGQDIASAERNQALEQMQRAQSIAAGERAMADEAFYSNSAQKSLEYDTIIARQIQHDRSAAEQRALALEEYTRSNEISQAERTRALQELDEAQAIARGERDFDMREYYTKQLQATEERNWQLQQLQRAQAIEEDNRAFAISQRDNYDAATQQLSTLLSEARAQMGAAPLVPEGISRDDIAAETATRTGLYERAIDRAADRAASQNEAALIASGMDNSSTGDVRRAAVAEQIAPLYEDAYQRAADDALQYMSGLQDTLYTGFNAEMQARLAAYEEIANPSSLYMGALANAPELASGLGIGPSFANVGTGIYDAALRSANDYQAPLDVGSGFDPRLFGSIGPNIGTDILLGQTGIYDHLPSVSANNYQLPLNVNSAINTDFVNLIGDGVGETIVGGGLQPFVYRDLLSANHYNAPVNITGGFNPSTLGLLGQSALSQNMLGLGDAIFNQAGAGKTAVLNAGGYLTSVANPYGNFQIDTGADNYWNAANHSFDRAAEQSVGAGKAWADFGNQLSSFDWSFGKKT